MHGNLHKRWVATRFRVSWSFLPQKLLCQHLQVFKILRLSCICCICLLGFLRLYVRWCWVFKIFSIGMRPSGGPTVCRARQNCAVVMGADMMERKLQKGVGRSVCAGFKMTLRKSLCWEFVVLKGWRGRKILDKRRRRTSQPYCVLPVARLGLKRLPEQGVMWRWYLSRHTGGLSIWGVPDHKKQPHYHEEKEAQI